MRGHAQALIDLIRSWVPGCRAGAEIGVWRGHTSFALLSAFPQLQLYAVDPWDAGLDNPTMPKTQQELTEAKREFLRMTEFARCRCYALQCPSVEASRCMNDEFLDFVFIDGNHTEKCVVEDLDAWWPKLGKGGLFCGHDYNGVGDRRGRFGVKRAVDRWADNIGVRVNVVPGRCHIWWVVK